MVKLPKCICCKQQLIPIKNDYVGRDKHITCYVNAFNFPCLFCKHHISHSHEELKAHVKTKQHKTNESNYFNIPITQHRQI